MFGYATDETEECMPLTVVLAHALNRRLSELRRQGALWWARPDSKTQVGTRGGIHVFVFVGVHVIVDGCVMTRFGREVCWLFLVVLIFIL